jgi:hypothetical protein
MGERKSHFTYLCKETCIERGSIIYLHLGKVRKEIDMSQNIFGESESWEECMCKMQLSIAQAHTLGTKDICIESSNVAISGGTT